MKRFCLGCFFILAFQPLFSQNWAGKHFKKIGIKNLYNIHYVGRNTFVAQDDITDKYGYIDRDGKIVIPFTYEWLGCYSEELIPYVNEGKYGYINTSNKIEINNIYKEADSFHEGVAAVTIDGEKFGFIDRKGECVIPFKFDYSCRFSEGLAAIKIKDKWGYIDHSGDVVIDTLYDRVNDFMLGSAIVGICIGEKMEVNDEYGNHYFYRKIKYGLVDHNGKLLTPLEYDKIGELKGDKYIVEKDNCFGVIDVVGQVVLPCIYNGLSNLGTHEALWLDSRKIFIDDFGKIMDELPR